MSNLKSNVQGRWSSQEGIELSGNPIDLGRLAGQLIEVTEGLTIILAELSNEMIKPYEGAISHIVVHREPGAKLQIARIGNVMQLSGDTSYLHILAQILEFPDNEPLSPIYHVHIEFYPDHFFLAPDSEPLIIYPSLIRRRHSSK